MMDLRSIKPGMSAASLAGKFHPRTGEALVPLGYTSRGVAIWPVLGGDDDNDPDDPRFTGEGGSSDDSDDEDESEDDEEPIKKKSAKHRKDDDDEDDEDDKPRYTQAEYDALRNRMRKADQRSSQLEKRLAALENKDKPEKEVAEGKAKELQSTVETLTAANRALGLRLAVATTPIPGVEWVDSEDALALAEKLGYLDDVEIEDDGTVNRRSLRTALKELAKRKPHLVVKKASGRTSEPDDEDDEDESDQRSAPPMNGKRKGKREGADRAALAKRFPVLGRL